MFPESLTFIRLGGILFNMNNWYIPIVFKIIFQFGDSSCIYRMGDESCIVIHLFILSGVLTSYNDSEYSASLRLDLLRLALFCNSDNLINSIFSSLFIALS